MRLLALTFLLVLLIPSALWAAQTTSAKQALIIDYETGQVLLNKNADQQMPTSSMSKVMTMYMVFDALEKGVITLDSKFRVSDKAWSKGGSKMFVPQGKNVKIEDLVRGVIVQSGNDATIVLAEGLAQSEEAFATKMTEKALELGMKNSNFVNASGWPDKKHYSTAEDLALLAKRMIQDFPEHYKFYAEKEFTYSNIKQQNRNPLLNRNIGADGLKTGHTEIGGYGLIGTAKQEGRRVIMVINGLESESDRANESVRLIEWALDGFININLLREGQKLSQAPVTLGQQEMLTLIASKDVKMTLPKVAKDKFTVDLKYKTPLIAPINSGDEVGTIVINVPGLESKTYPLLAGEDIQKIGFFKEIWSKAKRFLTNSL